MLASKSHRIELVACVAALALGGCMKIYPDPELPDIEVEWYDGDCVADTSSVLVTLTGVDDTTVHHEVTAPCADVKVTFKDVARQRYKLDGMIVDAMGQQSSRSEHIEIDLRNGIDETTYLYFGGFTNFRADWTFDMGATCASLAVDGVQIMFLVDDVQMYGASAPCPSAPLFGGAPDGVYTVKALAYTEASAVAMSAEMTDVALSFDSFVDLGTFVLTPCGGECP